MPVPLPKAILGVEEAGSATGNEKQWDGTKSHKLGCVYFQEPEFSELKSVQPSNHGIYLPPDTQEHAGSGRASSMPRLTVDPQVKSNYLPYAVASWAVLNWWVMEKTSAIFRWALDLPPAFPVSKTWLTGLLSTTCSSTRAFPGALITTASRLNQPCMKGFPGFLLCTSPSFFLSWLLKHIGRSLNIHSSVSGLSVLTSTGHASFLCLFSRLPGFFLSVCLTLSFDRDKKFTWICF